MALIPLTLSKSIESDDYLDELLKEFKESQISNVAPENNKLPLNAQSQYLKNDNCNCTKFYLCDVSGSKNNSKESEEEDGEELDLINIRLNVPEGGCPHYLDICCEVAILFDFYFAILILDINQQCLIFDLYTWFYRKSKRQRLMWIKQKIRKSVDTEMIGG